jgi:hypothetical protein
MERKDEFKELARFSGSREADLLTGLLTYGDVKFKLTESACSLPSLMPTSHTPIVVQVLGEDLQRAKELLAQYRKIQGVPFS